MVLHLKDNDFKKEILESKGISIVDFWAPWCGPCKMIGPIFESLAGKMSDVKFAKVNVDESPQTAGQFNVTSIPTLVILKDGAPVDVLVGFKPEDQLKDAISKHL